MTGNKTLDFNASHCNSLIDDYIKLTYTGVINDLIIDFQKSEDFNRASVDLMIYNLKKIIANMPVNKLKIIPPGINKESKDSWHLIRCALRGYSKYIVEIPKFYLGLDQYEPINSFKILLQKRMNNADADKFLKKNYKSFAYLYSEN